MPWECNGLLANQLAKKVRNSKPTVSLLRYKQKWISHITEEYSDAVQGAARLSVAGESFLIGKKSPVNVASATGRANG